MSENNNTSKTSTIEIKVGTDENGIPERMMWSA